MSKRTIGWYKSVARPLLFNLPPEVAHAIATIGMRTVATCSPRSARPTISNSQALSIDTLGQTFPNPIGLAAGFDKNATHIESAYKMGFGFTEVGTVTWKAQQGNPKPRIFRLQKDKALINRLGFNNRGVDYMLKHVRQLTPMPIGINIGKLKATSEANAPAEYAKCAQALAPHASYITINVSSPNTPGLRNLQDPDKLIHIVQAVRVAARKQNASVPILVKLSPDNENRQLYELAALAQEQQLSGIIASNTTLSRPTSLQSKNAQQVGGLSGRPLRARALEVLKTLSDATNGQLCLISVGGIESSQDVWERMQAGASLIQLYTSLIYEGPLLPRRILSDLSYQLKAQGLSQIQQIIGTS